jgi:Mg-chelatase subunit ChlD
MNKTCPKCNAANPEQGKFCQNCGTLLQATMVQGKTVLMTNAAPPNVAMPQPVNNNPVQMSPQQMKTIIQHAEKTFGPNAAIGMQNRLGQREETVFVIDHSGSMGELYDHGIIKLEAAKRGNNRMLLEKEQIDPDDEIGIVQFDHTAQVLLKPAPIRSHKQQIMQTINTIQISGGTDINKGLKAAESAFNWNRHGLVRRIVLLTDGHGGNPINTANRLKSNGVVIDVIGIGPSPGSVNEKLLRAVASIIEGEVRYRFIKDQQTLVAHYTRLGGKTATS